MIDTIRVKYSGVSLPPQFYEQLREEYPKTHIGLNYSSCNLWDSKIGRVYANGNSFFAEMSVGRFVNGNNEALMTRREALDALDEYMRAIESKLHPYALIPDLRMAAVVKRADFYYQQKIPSVPDALNLMANAVQHPDKVTRCGSSLAYPQSRDVRAVWYDKGLEADNLAMLGILRHEEQIRDAKRLQQFIDVQRMTVNTERIRAFMNERYKDINFTSIKTTDTEYIRDIVREHGQKGLAALALVLDPSLHVIAREELARNTYFANKRLANDLLARSVQCDLRVPADAWEDGT